MLCLIEGIWGYGFCHYWAWRYLGDRLVGNRVGECVVDARPRNLVQVVCGFLEVWLGRSAETPVRASLLLMHVSLALV
jgi:hypothetical protein